MLTGNDVEKLLLHEDALALTELIRRKTVSSMEVIEAMIRRVERLDVGVNSVVIRFFEEALRQAERVDPSAPLAGVPMLLKDAQSAWTGHLMTQGSRLLTENVARQDSDLVRRLLDAGLIIAGRTNAAELGSAFETAPPIYGPVRNPWAADRSAGGSSGGAAAAVAARIVPAAHAGDGAGSIRVPAAFCGVFGLKPTRGRVPMGPDVLESPGGVTTSGFVTISVRDNAALLDAVSGSVAGAPYSAAPFETPLLKQLERPPEKLRIALVQRPLAACPLDAEVRDALHDTAKLCGALGHELVGEDLPIDDEPTLEAIWQHWAVSICAAVHRIDLRTGKPGHVKRAGRFVQLLWEKGRSVTAADYLANLNFLQQVSSSVARWMESRGYDAWLSPVAVGLPPRLGWLDAETEDPERVFERQRDFFSFTPLINHMGTPAMSVPLNWSAQGLPIGAHICGRSGQEALLLRLARQLEIERPWRDRVPAAFGLETSTANPRC